MLEFEIDLSAIKAIGETAKRLQDFRAPLAESGAWLERQAKERFQKEEDPDGKPWAPLKPSTLKQRAGRKTVKRKVKGGLKEVPVKSTNAILRETAIMAAAIAFRPPTKDTVRVVSPVEYSIFHQLGTKTMEARPFLGINERDVTVIRGIFADYIEGR